MTKPEIGGIAPFFIVRNVPAAQSFYRDMFGCDITFEGPSPDDIYFGIAHRSAAMIMLKAVGGTASERQAIAAHGFARWNAYLYVSDPDTLATEFSSRNVEFSRPLSDDRDGLRGFEVKDFDGYVLYFGRPNDRTPEHAPGCLSAMLLRLLAGETRN